MEILEENLDEIFDLKPIIPEIYNKKQSISWINSCYAEEILINTKPSSSAAAASPPPLISFENLKFSSLVFPTNNSDTDYNSNKLDHEMPNDYSLTSQIINFSSSVKLDESYDHDSAKAGVISQERLSTATRTPLQAREHLLVERKRRDNLRHLFITLSKVVPGLKKLDKASLLEDAIDHLKALQERVRVLEEEDQEIKKSSIQQHTPKEYDPSSHYKLSSNICNNTGKLAAPEIQARISEKHVLIKIFCKKEMELMSRIPCEIEKIQLNVIDIRIMPFGGAALDITILAEMQNEFRGAVLQDIVDHLHTVFLDPIA